MLITHRTTPPDPFYFRIPHAPLSLVFSKYGNALRVMDAIQAVENAWIQAAIIKSTGPVGIEARVYAYHSAVFFIEPGPRLSWETYQTVTFGIMEVLQKILHEETNFVILGDNYEGNLGRGNVHNIP